MNPEIQILMSRVDELNSRRNLMPEQMAGARKRLMLKMRALAHKAEEACGIHSAAHRRKLVEQWRKKLLA